ncbi:MAG: glycoside hydrolase [Chitinophagales bacterium]
MPLFSFQKLHLQNLLLLALLQVSFCSNGQKPAAGAIYLTNSEWKLRVDPVTLSMAFIGQKNKEYEISAAAPAETVKDLVQEPAALSWSYPAKKISVNLQLKPGYADLTIRASAVTDFTWPLLKPGFNAYTIPLSQGKYIPVRDSLWIDHMTANGPFSGSQDLSMQFFASNGEDAALVYIIKNMFNNKLFFFNSGGSLAMKFKHDFVATVKDKQYGFRVYLTKNNTADIARTYRKYIQETSRIVTLEEKAKDNPNIRKLYGAPHIYIWNMEAISVADILKWKSLKSEMVRELSEDNPNPTRHIFDLFKSAGAESGNEFISQLNAFKQGDYVIKYHQNLLVRALSEALVRKDFYAAEAWKNISTGQDAKTLIAKGLNNLSVTELYRLNELLLYAAYPGLLRPIKDWGGAPPSMLDDIKAAGIHNAWLGLSDWVPGELHPDFIAKARELGFLIGPYDSYHSIHQPGKEKWLTAKFEDTSLYNSAFVMNKEGKPVGGFLGAGRQLNPTLALPSVKERVNRVMRDTNHEFNSWFIDCDGTGEIFDDYTPGRMTDQQQDLQARLQRMGWIRDTFKLVIGSEVGNDFAASTLAFGHGMTTPIVEWNDPDMRKNKSSKYYIGGYFSNTGGIPSRYVLQAPLKDKYLYTYFDNRFSVPLFQLVYNNSEITSHHWEWGSLKVASEIRNNSLKEILYNVPPLYHLDQENWEKFKDIITKHLKVFSRTHPIAVQLEMTDFEWLSTDRLVQKTVFENSLEMIANFGNTAFIYQNHPVEDHAVLIHDLKTGKYELYKP